TACLSAISSWMTSRHLNLNISKTELIIFPPAKSSFQPDISITVENSAITPTPQARCLGVILDSELSFVTHIQSVSKSCYIHLRNISKIRPYLTQDTAKTLIHALIISRIDYCNSLLTGLPKHRLSPLQFILNAAARLIFLARRSSSADPLCQSLHWLPVFYRVKYKILLLTYEAINQTAPTYISSLISKYLPTRPLRSAQDLRLSSTRITCSHSKLRFSQAEDGFVYHKHVSMGSGPQVGCTNIDNVYIDNQTSTTRRSTVIIHLHTEHRQQHNIDKQNIDTDNRSTTYMIDNSSTTCMIDNIHDQQTAERQQQDRQMQDQQHV
ncbi:uncharacterized protein LOC135022555, partial [Pseudophryne corroboree]|uniref:uncharacterized protein LOC135022555 n=1 Tax=Pseudophryne corroboree TaxID=495146 RepID=UPI0030816EE8